MIQMTGKKWCSLVVALGGAVILFAWIFQNTYLQRTAARASKLEDALARASLLTANDRLLFALSLTASPDHLEIINELRKQNRDGIDESFKPIFETKLPDTKIEVAQLAPFMSSILPKLIDEMSGVIRRLQEIDGRIREIRAEKAAANEIFFWLYIAGSLIIFIGTLARNLLYD